MQSGGQKVAEYSIQRQPGKRKCDGHKILSYKKEVLANECQWMSGADEKVSSALKALQNRQESDHS